MQRYILIIYSILLSLIRLIQVFIIDQKHTIMIIEFSILGESESIFQIVYTTLYDFFRN